MAASAAACVANSYRVVSRHQALAMTGYRHAVHAMLHSSFEKERKLFGYYPVNHAVMLQMRFDGLLGFPGGFIEDGESLEEGLQRELSEELGPAADNLNIDENNLLISHVSPKYMLCLHFYSKEININVFRDIERRAHEETNHDLETLGIIRCPLYTLSNGEGGLPMFLQQKFIGNAREQLLHGLKSTNILTGEEIEKAMRTSDSN